jgi:hypothetical protein
MTKKTQKSAAKRKPHPLDALPFVAMNGKRFPRNCWNVASTGDYVKDCELGREYAKQALLYMAVSDPDVPPGALLSDIIFDMMANFQPFPKEDREKSSIANADGIVLGFTREIGAHAERSKNIDQMLLHFDAVQVTKTAVYPCRAQKLVHREE